VADCITSAVEAADQAGVTDIAGFVRGHQIGTENRRSRGKFFPGVKLAGVALPFPHRAVIIAAVAGDVRQRIGLGDMAGRALPITTASSPSKIQGHRGPWGG